MSSPILLTACLMCCPLVCCPLVSTASSVLRVITDSAVTLLATLRSEYESLAGTPTYTQPFNGPLPETTQVGRYQKKHSPTPIHPDHQHPLSTTIYSIFLVRSMWLKVLFHNLSPGSLWSTSSSGTLYFIHHKFLQPIIILLQHTPIPSQPVLLQYDYVSYSYSLYQLNTYSLLGTQGTIKLDELKLGNANPGAFLKPRVCGFDGLQTWVPGFNCQSGDRPVLTVSLLNS